MAAQLSFRNHLQPPNERSVTDCLLERQLEQSSAELQRLRAVVAQFENDLEAQACQIETQNAHINEQERKISKLRKRQDSWAAYTARMESDHIALGALVEQSRMRMKKLEVELEKSETAVCRLQSTILSHSMKGLEMAEKDKEVERQFFDLNRRVNAWVSHQKPCDLGLDSSRTLTMHSTLLPSKPFIAVSYSQEPYETLLDITTNKKLSTVLLTALVNSTIYTHLISNPYFYIDHFVSSLSYTPPSPAIAPPSMYLEAITNVIARVDFEAALMWRAELLKILKPAQTSRRAMLIPDNMDLAVASKRAMDMVCIDLARNVVMQASNCGLLADDDHGQATEDLMAILRDAAELAAKLWRRNSAMQVHGLESIGCEPYSAARRDVIKPCNYHNAALDDDATALDGMPIAVMLSPAVTVRGRSDGSGLDSIRIWKRAEVLLDVRKQPESDDGGAVLHQDTSGDQSMEHEEVCMATPSTITGDYHFGPQSSS